MVTFYTLACFLFMACGKADSPDISSGQKVTENNGSTQPKEEENVVVASGTAGEYLVELILKNGYYEDNKLSAYQNTYQGKFYIKVSKDGQEHSNLTVVYDNSKEGLHFPPDGKIQLCDYNGDGWLDFAIGQRIGSSAKEYHFFTITEKGKVYQMKPDIVADEEYFPLFKVADGKIQYCQYNQKDEKYLNKTVEISVIKK